MKKMITVVFILFLVTVSLTGCKNPEPPETTAVAIVLGNHANSYALNLANPDLASSVARAAANGYISVIRCDGQPTLVSADLYAIPAQYRNADPKKLEADAQQRAAKILASLADVKAEVPELDTLEALWQAVRSLAAAPGDARREIIVIDTGLSTSGELDFRHNLLSADPAAIADFLDEKGALPDLASITVKWFQLGDVAPLQTSLSHGQVTGLRNIWAAIIEKSGGTVKFSDMTPVPQVNDPAEYPAIATVNLPPETTLSFDPMKATVFNEQQVRFVADTAKYVDPVAATTALRPAADYIIAHPEFTALLIGTTATGNQDRCLRLSAARAEAVRTTMVSIGVPEAQLLAQGLGFDDPWHISDIDPDGKRIEQLASQNRKVVLMDADTAAAKEIIRSATNSS